MLDSYCRLCAEIRQQSELVDIQDNVASNLNIEYKIFHCFQLQLENDIKLPKSICTECFEQVITVYDYHEKVHRAQQTLYSILAELKNNLDVKLESINNLNDEIDIKESITDLDKSTIVDTTDFGHSVFDNDIPDVKSGSEDESEDDIPLNERKLRDQKIESSSEYYNGEKIKSDPEKTANARIRKLLEILKEWKTYKKWFCIKCDDKIEIGTIKDLKKHWVNVHKSPPQYKCIVCDKVYEKFDLFRKHIQAHRDKHKYKCDVCGKYSYKRAHHDRHIEIHLKIRKYMCSTCGKSFKTHGSLYSHSRMHLPLEQKNKYRCDVCNKCFNSASNLTSHKKIHAGIKEYTCDQCGKMFTQKVNLDQHYASRHSDETPFHCSLCPRAFKTIYRLKSHQTLHTNVRPFKCETCGKAFREKGMMKAHTKIHTTELPFECEYCKKCFKLKSFLKIHLRQHTGERPYSCQDCNHHFTNWSNYSKHMKGRHGINIKSKTTQFLQQQRLQLMKQEELVQMQPGQEHQQMNSESSDNNNLTLNNINSAVLAIPQQVFQSDV